MAARSKSYEFLRCRGLEGQHADGTGSGLESRRRRNSACPQHRRSVRATKPNSFRESAQPIAQSILQPGRAESVQHASGSEPILQPANPRFLLLPALAECFARERLQRRQQRGRDARLQQSRLSQPWRWGQRTLPWRSWALTFDNEQPIRTFMKYLSALIAPGILHNPLAFTLALALSASVTLQAAETGRTFASPEAAVDRKRAV